MIAPTPKSVKCVLTLAALAGLTLLAASTPSEANLVRDQGEGRSP
jgi:hypothetical protein